MQKKVMHKKIFILVFFTSLLLFKSINCQLVFIISVPKCGTHLLIKCIELLNYPLCCAVHLPYTKEIDEDLTKKNLKKIFIYRDPRDQIISLMYWARTSVSNIGWPNINFNQLTVDEQLYLIIKDSSWAFPHTGIKTKNINDFYLIFLPWLKSKDTLAIKFEDIIGEEGGGSKINQLNSINKIAKFLDIEINDEKLNYISKNLFGQTATFRNGKIGIWKNYFTQQHKNYFKEITNSLINVLGYEPNQNW